MPDFCGRNAVEAWVEGQQLGLVCQCRGLWGPRVVGEFLLVVDQEPPPGAKLGRGSILALFVRVEPGRPDGVREPRRPLPRELDGRGEKPLPQDVDQGVNDLG